MTDDTKRLLRFFNRGHLKGDLCAVSDMFHTVAHTLASTLEGPEAERALEHLLAAKDCAVRAALPSGDLDKLIEWPEAEQ